MGIKNLKKIIDDLVKEGTKACQSSASSSSAGYNQAAYIQRSVPLSVFEGKRVAVDASYLLMRNVTSIWPKEVDKTKYPEQTPNIERFNRTLIQTLQKNVEDFLNAGVTPVYVFEGQSPPEKAETNAKRQAERDNAKKLYDSNMELALSYPPHLRSVELIEEIKKQAKKIFPEGITYIMRTFFYKMGLPTIQCSEESERLCAKLCLEGYCSAAFTIDRDVLVHGCPMVITGFGGNVMYKNKEVRTVDIMDLREMLIALNFNFTKFVDMCIMCGCDYNDNVPGIGAGKCYKFIKEYGSIENIPAQPLQKSVLSYINSAKTSEENKSKYTPTLSNPKTILNYESCRKRFGYIDIKDLMEDFDDLNKLSLSKNNIGIDANEFLSIYGLQDWLTVYYGILNFHETLPNTKDTEKVDRPDIVGCGIFTMTVGLDYKNIWGI
jgi:5'-3' exonuclease